MSSHYLDTRHFVETPEGIDLQSELAGAIPRSLAYAIDLLYRSLLLGAISIALAFAGKMGVGLILIISFLLEWFYPVIYEVYFNGQTPGKKGMGLQVVNQDLTPVTWSSSITRNLLRFVDFLPAAYISGLISMIISTQFQRLGDLAAGTIVIHKQTIRHKVIDHDYEATPSPVPLSQEEQSAIINFTERRRQLSEERQHELAEILSPVTHKKGTENIELLCRIGSWFLGGNK